MRSTLIVRSTLLLKGCFYALYENRDTRSGEVLQYDSKYN
nr:MAG TPA_asm: hypothetical protein [Inoviridae sp.]